MDLLYNVDQIINYSMNLKNESFLIFETGGSIFLERELHKSLKLA